MPGILPDPAGMEALMRHGTDELADALLDVAREVMNAAIEDPLPHTHDVYRASFGIDVGVLDGRLVATVYNTDRTAVWVELGAHAHETPVLGYHVMYRALERNRSNA